MSGAPVGGRLDGLTNASADWSGLRVLVAGLGVSGFAAADALHERGALVVGVDGGDPSVTTALGERARILDILGGLFVAITLSVIIQVGSFKLTGKRVFRMAPLQHHFELKGWSEVLVVVRFWIIQGICVIVGLGLFYAGWAADK